MLTLIDIFPQMSGIVDMFPDTDDINLIATRHVESVVILDNKNPRSES